jgi:predicted ester cyclase
LKEVWNKGNVSLVDDFLTADYVYHGPGGAEIKGIEGMKQFVINLHTHFPDNVFTVEDMVAEGEKVIYHWSQLAMSNGWRGIKATIGKKILMTGFILDRFEGGKIVETWETVNMLEFYQQLGIEPPKS